MWHRCQRLHIFDVYFFIDGKTVLLSIFILYAMQFIWFRQTISRSVWIFLAMEFNIYFRCCVTFQRVRYLFGINKTKKIIIKENVNRRFYCFTTNRIRLLLRVRVCVCFSKTLNIVSNWNLNECETSPKLDWKRCHVHVTANSH